MALGLKNKLKRSEALIPGPLFHRYLLTTALVLAGLHSLKQFVLVGLDSWSSFGEHFILPVSKLMSQRPLMSIA